MAKTNGKRPTANEVFDLYERMTPAQQKQFAKLAGWEDAIEEAEMLAGENRELWKLAQSLQELVEAHKLDKKGMAKWFTQTLGLAKAIHGSLKEKHEHPLGTRAPKELVERFRELLGMGLTGGQISNKLNQEGYKTPTGLKWTRGRVASYRGHWFPKEQEA